MPKYSENFNLIMPVGTDLWNPFTLENPAIENIDTQMYKNQNNGVPIATYVKSSTVHTLVRSVPSASMFRFLATDDYRVGDTFTVDGNIIAARMSDGSQLNDYGFRINSNVLCCVNAGILTIFTNYSVVSIDEKINDVKEEIGDVFLLETENKDNLVSAINEQNSNLANVINTALLSGNGYFRDKKTGFIIQWGLVDIPSGAGSATITFPIQFPNKALRVFANSKVITGDAESMSVIVNPQVNDNDRNNAYVYVRTIAGLLPSTYKQAQWLAIGY